jgi:hypothetical protein
MSKKVVALRCIRRAKMLDSGQLVAIKGKLYPVVERDVRYPRNEVTHKIIDESGEEHTLVQGQKYTTAHFEEVYGVEDELEN